MIREQRNRAKLQEYYDQYRKTGKLDPNMNPWVAASWEKSRSYGAPSDIIHTTARLPKAIFGSMQQEHKLAIDYVQQMCKELEDFLQSYDVCVLLLDHDCVVLRNYALPFYGVTPGEIEGVRVGVENIGTTSISVALDTQAPFWMFGPEMWTEASHDSDAGSAPVMINGEISYIITLVAMDCHKAPREAVWSTMLTMRRAMEIYLQQMAALQAQDEGLQANRQVSHARYSLVARNQLKMPGSHWKHEDMEAICSSLLQDLAGVHGQQVKTLSPEAKQLLLDSEWPGNIRQLQGVLENAVLNTSEAVIQAANINLLGDIELPEDWRENPASLKRLWKYTGGSTSKMASLMQVSRTTVYRYLKKYGLEKD